jgi:hypothetical protein
MRGWGRLPHRGWLNPAVRWRDCEGSVYRSDVVVVRRPPPAVAQAVGGRSCQDASMPEIDRTPPFYLIVAGHRS